MALLFGVLGDFLPGCLRLEKGGVVSGMGVSFAIRDLDDASGDDVEEVAVVRDEDDRAAVVFEEAFQPADGIGVEVASVMESG